MYWVFNGAILGCIVFVFAYSLVWYWFLFMVYDACCSGCLGLVHVGIMGFLG